MKPYDLGYTAGRCGRSTSLNPFALGTYDYNEWNRGRSAGSRFNMAPVDVESVSVDPVDVLSIVENFNFDYGISSSDPSPDFSGGGGDFGGGGSSGDW